MREFFEICKSYSKPFCRIRFISGERESAIGSACLFVLLAMSAMIAFWYCMTLLCVIEDAFGSFQLPEERN